MFYHLLYPLSDRFFPFNVFHYISFRSILAAMTSLLIFMFFGDFFIRQLKVRTEGIIRRFAPEGHKKKMGTPSMGGLIIIFAFLVGLVLCGNFSNKNIYLYIVAAVAFGFLGFLDDFLKEAKKDGRGLRSKVKLKGQLLISFVIGLYLYFDPYNVYYFSGNYSQIIPNTAITVPFFRDYFFDLGWFYIPFAMFIIVGTSNGVNLTDGLDGLAIGQVIIALIAFTVITYMTGSMRITEYLRIPYNPRVGEMTVALSALVGASIGFLWYNSHPAQIFMGDTGSLSLGSLLGITALLLKSEVLLAIIGGVFVVETLSVIIQVMSFKLFGKRPFKMAPIHHHFELMGWHENKIITRFWIIGSLLTMIAFSLFKLR